MYRQSVTRRATGLIRPRKHAGNTGLGHIPSRIRRWLCAITPEEVGRRRVGVAVFSKMSYVFGILSMAVSGELAKVLGLCRGLRPDGKASISQSSHVLRVLVDRLRPGGRRSR